VSARQLEAGWSAGGSRETRLEAHHAVLQDETTWRHAACGPLARLKSSGTPYPAGFVFETIPSAVSNSVHTFPIYAEIPVPYPEGERRNVVSGSAVRNMNRFQLRFQNPRP
jgi:hypothetical protein